MVLAFLAIYVIWGSTYLAIRIAVESLPPFAMAGARFALAGGVLWLFGRAMGAAPLGRKDLGVALVSGALMLLGGNGAVVWAEQWVASGAAALLVAAVPLWMVLLDWASAGTRPGPRIMVGLAVGFLGLGLLLGAPEMSSRDQLRGGRRHHVRNGFLGSRNDLHAALVLRGQWNHGGCVPDVHGRALSAFR